MTYKDEFYEMARDILRAKGSFEPNENPMYLKRVYRDEKITILLYIEYPTQEAYSLNILINLSSNASATRESFTPFALSSQPESQQTLVYSWQKYPYFSRPGKWQNYMEKMANEIRDLWERTSSLNGQSVDDETLFSDDGAD